MYFVQRDVRPKGKMDEVFLENGFPMGSSRRVYKIGGSEVREIIISSSQLASPMVTDLVYQKYHKLISTLTELLVDDEGDSSDSMREALNQIEKFRLEIKNKYRNYLKRKDLELMSKQLMILKKEAMERYLEIRNQFLRTNDTKRSK